MSHSEIQDQPWAIIIFGGYWAAPLAVGTDRFMRCFGNPTDQTKSVLVGNRFPNVISRSLQANQLDCFWVCPDNSIFWDHEQCSTSIGSSFPTHTHTHTHRWVLFSRATTTAPPRESHLFPNSARFLARLLAHSPARFCESRPRSDRGACATGVVIVTAWRDIMFRG